MTQRSKRRTVTSSATSSDPSSEGTRAALLRAAIAIAEEDGVGAIGLREAARRAGLTHGAPYRHFESREALVVAVAEDGFRALLTMCIDAQTAAGSDPLARFQALGVTYITFALARPGQFRVMFGAEAAAQGDSVRSAEAAVFSLAVNAIASAQREGLVDDGDPQELAMLAWSSAHGLAVLIHDGLAQWVGFDTASPERLARRFTARLFEGLRTRKGNVGEERKFEAPPIRKRA
ncbi:TetR/AcrR family transcriptional regulator [Pendulispora albinea]|uniref:TetR/AcrR family transcriptional regulator n=1 Tax=Pendulispora albinea TaxID=2741071 RepID=A0ABZ2LXX1_9BACT